VNPIPGPIILLALPALAAIVTYLVRRWALVAAFLAAATVGGLAILCFQLPLDRSAFVLGQEVAFGRPVVILGQTLLLDAAGQAWLALVLALAPFWYLLAWRISQGRSFFSFSLIILALYALLTLLQDFELALLVFGISTTLATFIIQGGQPGSIRGAQRYLVVTLLAIPFLLAATWLMDEFTRNPASAEIARNALLPVALGFGLLLAAFPFGTWMPALAADAPPIVTAFVFTAGQAMAIFLALVFLRDYPAILNEPSALAAIRLAGIVMVASGGLMACVQRDFGRLFGYAALSDLGFMLLAFSTGGSQSVSLVLLHGVGRGLALTLMAASLAILRHQSTTDRFDALGGVARRLPVATLGLIVGGLSLAGFPFTAGFSTHWAVLRAVADEQGISTLILLLSSAGIIVGLLRGLSAMLGSRVRDDVIRQPRIATLIVLVLGVLVILLGIYPQLFLAPVQNAARAFSLF
jgi:formate hydrogenlyase subunit 3/multisubunit Na+/H+ antiporter MnhD subunit